MSSKGISNAVAASARYHAISPSSLARCSLSNSWPCPSNSPTDGGDLIKQFYQYIFHRGYRLKTKYIPRYIIYETPPLDKKNFCFFMKNFTEISKGSNFCHIKDYLCLELEQNMSYNTIRTLKKCLKNARFTVWAQQKGEHPLWLIRKMQLSSVTAAWADGTLVIC